uniref:Uncharacterized protein n=1 Tax=Kalanchoe fedtschenkoi TaxID=63787 RepID=A0A7N0V3A6_KALFE
MEKCRHFTMRGAVAEFRKQDWRLSYPFPLPKEPMPEQINSLLPPLDIHRSRWWNCEGCVEDFIEGDCPGQLNGAGPSLAPSDVKFATKTDGSRVDKVCVNISVAIDADANALQQLSGTDVGDFGAEGTTIEEQRTRSEDPKTNAICDATNLGLFITQKRKVMFDLNEPPTSETSEATLETDVPETEEPIMSDHNPDCDEIRKIASVAEQLEENTVESEASPVATAASPATEGLISDHNPDCNKITDLVVLDEEHAKDAVDSVASPVAYDAGMGNVNHSPPDLQTTDSFEVEDDDDLIPIRNKKALRRRKTPKYRTLAELIKEAKGQKSQAVQSDGTDDVVPTSDPQPKKSILKKKNKSQHSPIQEEPSPKLSDASKDAPRKEVKNRAFDFNLPLEKNGVVLDDNNLQPTQPCGKRKRRDYADEKDTSDTTVSEPTEMAKASPHIENGKCLLPKKRRIFGNEVNGVSDAEKSRRGKSCAMKAKHASKKRQSQNLVAERRKVPTTQSKKYAGKDSSEQIFGSERQKKKNHSDVIGCVSELRRTDESPIIVGKEVALGERPISIRAQDDAPKNEKLPLKRNRTFGKEALKTPTDNEKLCLEKIDTRKRKTVNHPASVKIVERGSKEKQNFNPVEEHGKVPPTQNKESVAVEADWRIFGAQKKKKNCIDNAAGKQHMFQAEQKKKKKNRGDVSGRACGHGPDQRRHAKTRKEMGLKDSGTVNQQFAREQEALTGMHLLSMVAAETEDAILPLGGIREKALVPLHAVAPLNSNMLTLGYSGCAQATVASEDFLTDEAEDVELLMLGPEDLPLRSHRIIKPIAAEPMRVVKWVDSGARPFMNENTKYQRSNAAGGSRTVQQ